ncbi:MAG TPA: hypothetical protein VKM55_14725 [Candidatus Lokiarchaeia archaeon]|nr:hypothetical protein [Candidatus Lokiarchaeia archaeon]
MQGKDRTLDEFLGKSPILQQEKEEIIKRMLDLADFDEEDWTFRVADTKEFTHLIFHEYPARMIPQVARKLIKLYYPSHETSQDKKPLLDPFGGSGTVCVEALLRDIDSIAFDLNPLAHLVEKVKTTIVDPAVVRKCFKSIMHLVETSKGARFSECIPAVSQIDFWYNDTTIVELSAIKHAILQALPMDNQGNDTLMAARDFFFICLGKTARDCSYQRKGENKTYRMEKEKMVEFDKKVSAVRCFKDVVSEYLKAVESLHEFYSTRHFTARTTAILGNSMILDNIADNSIDLIVTSPPYGDSHTTVAYGQFSRFPLEWVLDDTSRVKAIDDALLGGIENEETFPDSSLLLDTCKKILAAQELQQQSLIKGFLDAIEQSTLQDVIDAMNEATAFIEQHVASLHDVADFASFMRLKEAYYSHLDGARSIAAKGNKWLDGRSLGKAGRFKVYDDRLGYVISFFSDFTVVLSRLYQVLDFDRKCCLVVGNRTVKGVKIPTDEIMIELGTNLGFEYKITYFRDIPNKRMPLSNSPSNVVGEKSPTMARESIIVLNKPGNSEN